MKLYHPKLISLLQKAYSAEKAASFAYVGHAGAIKDKIKKQEIKQIEDDEWLHRKEVLKIMKLYDIPISKFEEIKFHIIGKVIGYSCYIIGWFMPYYFAGGLESGNVCEYFRMIHYFHELGITKHDKILYELGIKEKEHEIYFFEEIKNSKLLPYFEKIFGWGFKSKNDIKMEELLPYDKSDLYCKR